jgi:hypothetical protein
MHMLNVNIDCTRRVTRNDKMFIFPFLKAPSALPVSLIGVYLYLVHPLGAQYTERDGRLLKYGNSNHVQYIFYQVT